VRDAIASREVDYESRARLRGLSYGLAAATVFAGVISAYFLVYYESLGPQVLLRNRPQFVQFVTYPAILACALGVACCASYLAARGRGTKAGWAVVWGCFALLNFYSLWSSRAIMDALSPFMSQEYLFPLQSYGFGFGIFGNLPVDLISIMLVAVICSAAYSIYRNESHRTRILRVLQLGSLSILSLPVYVLLFDTSEFNLHVTSFQEHYGVLQWFTNADLLVLASLMFLGSTILLARKRLSLGSP
jgi:hypothetical protein